MRPLLSARVPKASFHVTSSTMDIPKLGTAEVLDVVGIEIHGEVFTTDNTFVPLSVPINPQDSELFPRLAGIALPFDRWKCMSLGVHFNTAAPATRAGSIGMCVQFDPLDPDPPDLARLGQYESFSLGAVSENLSCEASWPESDPWLLTSATEDPNSSEDPNWRYPGKIVMLTSDSGTDDDDKVAGFVSISYHFRFARLKPLSNFLFDGETEGSVSVTDTGIPVVLETPAVSLGFWDWLFSNVTAVTSGTVGAVKYIESVLVTAGEWYSGLNITVTAPAAAGGDGQVKAITKPGTAQKQEAGRSVTRVVGPRRPVPQRVQIEEILSESKLDEGPVSVTTWANPDFHPSPEENLRRRELAKRSSRRSHHLRRKGKGVNPGASETSSLDEQKGAVGEPLAANDVLMSLYAIRMDTLETSTVITSTQNSAAGFEARVADNFTIAYPSRLIWRVATAGGQTRTLSSGRFAFAQMSTHG